VCQVGTATDILFQTFHPPPLFPHTPHLLNTCPAVSHFAFGWTSLVLIIFINSLVEKKGRRCCTKLERLVPVKVELSKLGAVSPAKWTRLSVCRHQQAMDFHLAYGEGTVVAHLVSGVETVLHGRLRQQEKFPPLDCAEQGPFPGGGLGWRW
jgi:hypothetical protein